MVNELKKENQWLTDVNSQALLNSIRNLDTAYKNFFRDPHGGRFSEIQEPEEQAKFSVSAALQRGLCERNNHSIPKAKDIPPCCTAGSKVP